MNVTEIPALAERVRSGISPEAVEQNNEIIRKALKTSQEAHGSVGTPAPLPEVRAALSDVPSALLVAATALKVPVTGYVWVE